MRDLKCIFLLFLVVCAISAHGGKPAPKEKAADAKDSAKGAAADAPAPAADAGGKNATKGGAGGTTFDINDYGATEGGKTDSIAGLTKAWAEACAVSGSTIVIGAGSYLVGPAIFEGPCKGPITIQLDGTLLATTDLSGYKENWLQFQHVDGLTITGKGTVDGQGKSAWPSNKCRSGGECKVFPMSMVFAFCKGLAIRGITSLNAKYFHFNIFSSENIEVSKVTITAPEDSPNTDGIHIGDNTNITIQDTTIGTGDDCISIGPGSVKVLITGVTCGPGHGISIGSLGKYKDEHDVKDITVKGCTLKGTTNGLRIKTFQDNPTPVKATGIHFLDITMDNVMNPILLDQEYCPNGKCTNGDSTVAITDVTFSNIKGTAANAQTIDLKCSKKMPCTQIALSQISLKPPAGSANITCAHAQGTSSDATLKNACFQN